MFSGDYKANGKFKGNNFSYCSKHRRNISYSRVCAKGGTLEAITILKLGFTSTQ